ncbi:DUF5684 domain-containing protein [Microbacterium sp. P03]|uniref:DUF5684 domain-containing protein n=1 Tax=Microbacterium sp. P03 TaxID=3366946 RepID=UPI00374703BD
MSDLSPVIIGVFLWLAVYVWTAASLHALFRKAGEEGWKAWVPFLNVATLLQLGGFSGWFVLLGLVPLANIGLLVLLIIAYHRINLAFRYGVGMTVLAALLLPVWSSILGWGSARWVGAPTAAAGPMRRGEGGDHGQRAPAAYHPAVSGDAPTRASTTSGSADASSVPPLPPRPPLPHTSPSSTGRTDDTRRPVAPAWAPSVDSAPAPRRSSAVSADELSHPTATVAQPPAFVPTPAPTAAPTASPAPAPSATSSSREEDAAPLDWWAVPPVPPLADEPPLPRRSNAVGLDPLDEDTRDVGGLGRDDAAVYADADAWAAPEIAPPPPAYSAGPLRSRRAAPAPDEFADEPFDTSFEVSAVAGAPTLGAPVSAMSSVSAVQTGAALPDDAVFRVEESPLDDDDDVFDETVVAVRRRAVWHLSPPLGAPIAVTSDVLILGRRPATDPDFPDAQLVPISDETRTMSKTHARLELRGDEWVIIDLDSTNGVVLLRDDGAEEDAAPGVAEPVGTSFLLGDAELHLIRDVPLT